LVVEVELLQRAAKENNARNLKSSGVKRLREMRGLFSSINYGTTSARRSGTRRDRA